MSHKFITIKVDTEWTQKTDIKKEVLMTSFLWWALEDCLGFAPRSQSVVAINILDKI